MIHEISRDEFQICFSGSAVLKECVLRHSNTASFLWRRKVIKEKLKILSN